MEYAVKENHHELFRLSALIAGFLSESLSEQEEQELQSWIAEQENHRILFEKICAEETMKEQLDRYRSGNAYPAFLRFAESGSSARYGAGFTVGAPARQSPCCWAGHGGNGKP